MPDTTPLLDFLKSQQTLALASHHDDIWIANVYFGIDDDLRIFFIGGEKSRNSQQILKNPHVAFSSIWFNSHNHADRKGVQGTGKCHIATEPTDIARGVELHNTNFPEFKERITVEWISDNEYQSRVWIIEPNFIKFWNDELYGDEGCQEFTFKQ